jgi:hypothetical protein
MMNDTRNRNYDEESERDAKLWLNGELSTEEYVDRAWARSGRRANDIVSREIYGGGRIGRILREYYQKASRVIRASFIIATDSVVVLAIVALSAVGFREVSKFFGIPGYVLVIAFIVWTGVVVVIAYRRGAAAIKGSARRR